MLRRRINPNLRRELEVELAWREYQGRRGGNQNRPREYLPAFLLVDPPERRR
jgi:hypothetical protein